MTAFPQLFSRRISHFLLCCLLLSSSQFTGSVQAQDWNADPNYEGADNLYHDYAMRQQEKEAAAAAGGGFGLPKYLVGAGVGWLVGSKFHCGRLKKKLESKHKTDQKTLYTQYYNDVYNLQQQNAEYIAALEQMGVRVK